VPILIAVACVHRRCTRRSRLADLADGLDLADRPRVDLGDQLLHRRDLPAPLLAGQDLGLLDPRGDVVLPQGT
jgi:hypothetical protein